MSPQSDRELWRQRIARGFKALAEGRYAIWNGATDRRIRRAAFGRACAQEAEAMSDEHEKRR